MYFKDRYGNGLECYVNQTFVEKLASKPPIVEKIIKLLQDIATELTIQWDSKGFKERMDKPSTLNQDQGRKLGPSRLNNDGNGNVRRKEVLDIPFAKKEERHAQDSDNDSSSKYGSDTSHAPRN